MVDKGFDIADILSSEVTLIISTFKKGRYQLNAKETNETARVVAVRTHVERVIGRPFKTVKEVEMFNDIILHSQYSKIKPFCSIVQIFSASNQPHRPEKKIGIVGRGFLTHLFHEDLPCFAYQPPFLSRTHTCLHTPQYPFPFFCLTSLTVWVITPH